MALRRGDLDLLGSRHDDYFDPEGQGTFGFFKDYDYKEHHSGHGGHHYHHDDDECCPLVVDFLCLAAILFSLTVATLILNQVIILEIMAGRRKRAAARGGSPLVFGGERQKIALNDREAFRSLDFEWRSVVNN